MHKLPWYLIACVYILLVRTFHRAASSLRYICVMIFFLSRNIFCDMTQNRFSQSQFVICKSQTRIREYIDLERRKITEYRMLWETRDSQS